ncbi:uracil-DNA glycosylase [Cohnella cholangitidis]|uniref:Uracil-DNA glycosylase n=1 Tax=Cohnella cholangitidis TaxID=2598458 RepID=A0A7G5BTR2_9BACL|nr:uracil-DNA glycosylase [Cohnella cholangitidis]QMV40346.1 uracil-DNA glycosylase [Cohnella cholangitidis]
METSVRTTLRNDWGKLLREEHDKPYFQDLLEKVEAQYREHIVYPPRNDIYRAMELTDYEEVKVVILGQDPYHGPNQAHGLSFSVQPGVKLPPSLRNIYKELKDDIGCPIPNHGYLEHWARQGVLLLNSVLTVRESMANSHRKLGWETYTDKIISLLNERETPVAFVLWGNHAQEKGRYIDSSRHFVLNSVHPSPLSAHGGFWGSKPFSQCNAFLRQCGRGEIDWRIPELEETALLFDL